MASRKALNRTKNVRGDPATTTRATSKAYSETATEDETTFIVETERVSTPASLDAHDEYGEHRASTQE